MNPIAKNILAFVVGIVAGCLVNMGLVSLGPHLVALPEGANVETMEGLRESMKLFAPINFLVPFLAHALGTLAGAFVAARVAHSYRVQLAVGIGCFFLIGGTMMVVFVGGPTWFIACDLLLAYIPMGLLGGLLGAKTNDDGQKSDPAAT